MYQGNHLYLCWIKVYKLELTSESGLQPMVNSEAKVHPCRGLNRLWTDLLEDVTVRH